MPCSPPNSARGSKRAARTTRQSTTRNASTSCRHVTSDVTVVVGTSRRRCRGSSPAALAAQGIPDTFAARAIALRDAVVPAEQNGRAAILVRGQIRTAESRVRAAKGALLPNATISLGQVNQSGERLDAQGRLVPYLAQQPWTYCTGLNLTVNLFDGGRRWNEVKRTRFDVARRRRTR